MKNSACRDDNEFEKRWTDLPANAAETNISGRMATNVTMFKGAGLQHFVPMSVYARSVPNIPLSH
jgi:hypothetical protein